MSNSNKTFLHRKFIGDYPILEIPESQYTLVRDVQRDLRAFLEQEELFNCCSDNYAELEKFRAKSLIEHMLGKTHSNSFMTETRLSLSRYVSNYLSSVRTYRHATQKKLAFNDVFKQYFNQQYQDILNSSKEFHFIEKLRNHAQHFGLPAHSVSFGSSGFDTKVAGWEENEFFINVDVLDEILLTDKDFPRYLIDWHKKYDGSLINLLLSHYSGICIIQSNIRKRFQEDIERCSNVLQQTLDLYNETHSTDYEIIHASIFQGKHKFSDSITVTPSYLISLRNFQQRYMHPTNIENRRFKFV